MNSPAFAAKVSLLLPQT